MPDFLTTTSAVALRPGGPVHATAARLRTHPRRDSRRARSLQLLLGLVAVGAGVGLLVRARLGVASWDVLHVGVAERLGWPVGTSAMAIGLGAAVLASLLGERPRPGSLVPLAVIGPAIDGTMLLVAPAADGPGQVVLLLAGLVLMAVGIGAYVTSDHGAGPSDLVFLGLSRYGLPTWASRLTVDGAVVAIGWLLGGPVGVGTVVVTLGLGPMVGGAIRLFDLTPARVEVGQHDLVFRQAVCAELEWELSG